MDTARSVPGLSDENRKLYMGYGTTILSMAVMAIVITAPTGAILINTLGEKWLSYDGDDEEQDPKQEVELAAIQKDKAEPKDDGEGPKQDENNGYQQLQLAE